MFGYVRIFEDELKKKDYTVFRSYYCGLCKTLKKEYGVAASMGLNYDSVFLALLLSSVLKEEPTCMPMRCIANPVKLHPVLKTDAALSYSAAVMLTLAILKLSDNLRDEKSIKALLSLILLFPCRLRLKKKHAVMYRRAKAHIKNLSMLEKQGCKNPDEAANAFASLLEELFVPGFIKDENTKRILAHMGYLLGRFIYLSDAAEDREKDKKKHCYNPYLASDAPFSKDAFTETMTLTLSTLASDYSLLPIHRNKAILDNIIYLGLPNTLKRITETEGEPKNEKSL